MSCEKIIQLIFDEASSNIAEERKLKEKYQIKDEPSPKIKNIQFGIGSTVSMFKEKLSEFSENDLLNAATIFYLGRGDVRSYFNLTPSQSIKFNHLKGYKKHLRKLYPDSHAIIDKFSDISAKDLQIAFNNALEDKEKHNLNFNEL